MKRTAAVLSLAFILGLPVAGCGDKDAKKDKSSDSDDKKDKKDSKDERSQDGNSSQKSPSGTAQTPPPSATPSATPTAATPPPPLVPTAGGASAFNHLGSDCELVITSDLAKLMSHPAFAREVTPKLRDLLNKPGSDKDLQKFQTFAKDQGLTEKSLQTLGLCARGFGKKPTFGFGVGGDLKPGAFVAFLEKVDGEKAKKELIDIGGVRALSTSEVTLSQMPDGVFVLADQPDSFKAMIPASNNLAKFKIDSSKELALYASESVMQEFIKPGKSGNEIFESIKEVVGHVDLTTGKAVFNVTCKSTSEAKKFDGFVAIARDKVAKEKLSGNPFGTLDIVKSTKSRVEGSVVIVEMDIPGSSLDQAAKALGKELDKLLK